MSDPLKDPRFGHLSWDPKFSRVPKRERKVKIDDRFKSMFTDAKFKDKYLVDKRGRKLQRDLDQDLRKYYDLSSSHSEDDETDSKAADSQSKKKDEKLSKRKMTNKHASKESPADNLEKGNKFPTAKKDRSVSVSSDSGHEGEQNESEESSDSEIDVKGKINLDLARGEGNLLSSSSSSSESCDSSSGEDNEGSLDDDDDDLPEHKWGELDADAPRTERVTRRLAVCNMDWDRIKAKDLLVMLNSFKAPLGIIRSVQIYRSQFGKERMAEEEAQGPKELRELVQVSKTEKISQKEKDRSDDEEENSSCGEQDEDEDKLKILHREKIRQYQLNRLKYFYAVVECDTAETANSIYEACDGIEYESSATRIDLRFIPDDMSFDDDQPVDQADDLGDLTSYKPIHFRNAALQQSKVELTWDETPETRKELLKKAFENGCQDLDSLNLTEILASGSSEEDEQCEDQASTRLKDLVHDILNKKDEKHESKQEEEAFFVQENKEDNDINAAEKSIDSDDDAKRKPKQGTKKSSSTPWQEYLEKRREKRRQKRLDIKQKVERSKKLNHAVVEDNDDFPAGIDMNDPYFKEELDKLRNPNGDPENNSDTHENADDNSIDEQEKEKQKQFLELLVGDQGEKSKNYSLKKLLKENDLKSAKKIKKNKRQIKERDNEMENGEPSSSANQNSEMEFKLNVQDSRFSALYQSHLYNIDPTEPAFKRTKNMQILMDAKLNNRSDSEVEKSTAQKETDTMLTQSKNEVAELNLLIKKVKSKASVMKSKKSTQKLTKNR